MPLDAVDVEKAFAPFGVGGGFGRRHQIQKFLGQQNCIAHFVFCFAGMDVEAGEMDVGVGGVEILIFQFTQRSAIYCVGCRCAESREIEVLRAAPDFFVGSKSDAYGTMGISGCSSKYAAADTISAMPALSSAPSRVVPSVTINS